MKKCSEWDHPRRCGEKAFAFRSAANFLGSPPQVRGKGTAAAGTGSHIRITPAGAGKSTRLSEQNRKKKDHPRRCGEKLGF